MFINLIFIDIYYCVCSCLDVLWLLALAVYYIHIRSNIFISSWPHRNALLIKQTRLTVPTEILWGLGIGQGLLKGTVSCRGAIIVFLSLQYCTALIPEHDLAVSVSHD